MTAGMGNKDELFAALGSKTALRRLGEPEEVSRVILFLLSKEASYITGAVRLSNLLPKPQSRPHAQIRALLTKRVFRSSTSTQDTNSERLDRGGKVVKIPES
jgi:hypothetical protein